MSIPVSQLSSPALVNYKFVFYICHSVFMFCKQFTVQKKKWHFNYKKASNLPLIKSVSYSFQLCSLNPVIAFHTH